uniref:UbiH/UbiF/VisC/COQ6 family ubiquinone biosynthesis hydroxylase n=1 Tax=Ningiella ruwaisensis TaxID=2364274 RepID=UPI00109EE7AA|nr:UbiH/UbiF/VisC/COQ6 family ubiquinone biosynthesis hydroxylase [Ningiella ruwaisensis]
MTTQVNKRAGTSKKRGLIRQVDIAVIGAGIVGQTLALLLKDSPLNILIIDASDSLSFEPEIKQKPQSFAPRVSAISLASQKTLKACGAWQNIKRKQDYTHMQVWEQDGFGRIDFDVNELKSQSLSDDALSDTTALGAIVENDILVDALYSTAQNSMENLMVKGESNIDYVLGEQIEEIEYAGDSSQSEDAGYQMRLSSNEIIVAKLLIGADGANSFVRQALGCKMTFWDYDHTAIVCNVKTQMPHNNTARQAFTPFGPLAFLPLPDPHQCSIVYSQDTQNAMALDALSDEEFCKALAVAIDMQLGPLELVTKRFSYPLKMRYVHNWVGQSFALIGDAAHTIHPLAGQGANLGISDALDLAANIKQSLSQNQPFYAKRQLRKYERKRKAQAQKVIATMEGFKRLFSGTNPLLKLSRNAGLIAANKLCPVKQFFIRQAQGDAQ